MFVKKPRVALQTILRSATGANASATLPTDLPLLRDDTSGLLVTTPTEVVTKLAEIEEVDLSPDTPPRSTIPLARICPPNPHLLRPNALWPDHPRDHAGCSPPNPEPQGHRPGRVSGTGPSKHATGIP